jgi:hydroxyacyl-ACP dehydratase HTD2-like protein with hotdog domain
MWAGGTMTWNKERALKVGEKATAVSTVAKVEKKGFEAGKPMVFVKQRIEVTVEGRSEPGMVEERAHVYQASVGSVGSRVPRQGESPQRPVTYLGVDADTFNQ